MNALFDAGPQYEAHAVPLIAFDPRSKAWDVIGGKKTYRVDLDARGNWSCTCPHWVHRAAYTVGRHCKHTLVVKELIEKDTTTPRTP